MRKPVAIDRDNFDDVLELFAPALKLPFAGGETTASFHELEDFHPDRLYVRLPFERVRDQERRQATKPRAAASPRAVAGPRAAEPTPPPALSGADLISQMLGDDEPAPPPQRRPRGEFEQMLHDITAPYTEPRPDPAVELAATESDRAMSLAMREVLHHEGFQSLESVWRGLWFLVRRLETDENLKVSVLDLPYEELTGGGGIATLRRVIVDDATGTPGGLPWAMVAGLYDFDPADESTLTQIAAVARSAGAPVISGVGPRVVGLEPAFETLRRSSDAKWIGLAMPRFLLRMPYGSETAPIEAFDFEEMPATPRHDWYLWGNPAIACAYLMGEAFRKSGWHMWPGSVSEIDGLPAHTYESDGESVLKPCAEVLLTEEAAELLLDRGLMPLLSIKGADRVRLARFQAIAEPATPLAGRWG